MSRLLILGATGSLGRHVLGRALDAGHDVTVLVRTPARLAADAHPRLAIHAGDLAAGVPPDLVQGQDALINCAGHVRDGDTFVALVDRIVTTVDLLLPQEQPVCWFLAGAALLDIGASGRRGLDLPEVGATYWPHRANFERLTRSRLDWRLLCPGPMVDGPPLAVDQLRVSLDVLPIDVPDVPSRPEPSRGSGFASLVPALIVPYANAAALMLGNLGSTSPMSRHRIGLARRHGS